MSKISVGIIMGSDSDLPIMSEATQILEEMNVVVETTIVSAHRTPERMVQYAKKAHTRGLKVIIAGAGGAAHLPGMVASLSPLPVIGVPIQSRNSIKGLDSLLSIVQMPPGVPVATVAVNGAKNAGLLALQILGCSDKKIRAAVIRYKKKLELEVQSKISRLDKLGVTDYLKKFSK